MTREKEVKIGVLLRGSLADALITESRKTLAPYAAIARAALVEYLQKRGYSVSDDLIWGGHRESSREDSAAPDNEVAVAATTP